jgi:hypothetical protein
VDGKDQGESILELQVCEAERSKKFNSSCEVCQTKVVEDNMSNENVGDEGVESVPHNPAQEDVHPHIEDASDSHGQWTVVKKKKSRSKVVK